MALVQSVGGAPDNKGSKEGITVAIRMRPLNTSEESNKRIWKVLPKYSSIAQTTRDGKPLPERITGRTFFTFDKTFGESADNKHVYDDVAKGIVNSVVEGLNGTIFAYGQTSSGKTYTMQGAGNLEQGMAGEGGLVHMAAHDIFSKITENQQRNFLVRVSFLEIYNEEVRDLLGDTSRTLKIREDPRQGVFVESQEELVTNFDGLLKILVRGDESRTFASTGMNERSSRSHTILRITIESREKDLNMENEDDKENSIDFENLHPSSDGAVRISTLNLVDLAGSESVRHTGATGERQKEGGLINQSLLTLSRVIVALGAPNSMHINFRDSKLTRILQPSLSGNARMAVICCATPSELYLEETRSTLQFASRAKLVKTNAQVNEVLDERSMIRRLQRELAEVKRNQTGPGQGRVQYLEAQVLSVGTEAMEAKKELDRLKASILNTGYILDQGASPNVDSMSAKAFDTSKKRRKSDGPFLVNGMSPSKHMKAEIKSPKTAPRKKRSKVVKLYALDVQQELRIVQEALATRNSFVRELRIALDKYAEQMMEKNSDLECMTSKNALLNEENQKAQENVIGLEKTVASLQHSLDSSVEQSQKALAEKDAKIVESFQKLEQAVRQNDDAAKDNNDLVARLSEIELERDTLARRVSSLESESVTDRESFLTKSEKFESSMKSLQSQISMVEHELKHETEAKLRLEESFATVKEEKALSIKSLESQLAESRAQAEKETSLRIQLEESLSKLNLALKDGADSLERLSSEKIEIERNLKQSQQDKEEMVGVIAELKKNNEALVLEKNSMDILLESQQQRCDNLVKEVSCANEQIAQIESQYESVSAKNDAVSVELDRMKTDHEEATRKVSMLEQHNEEALAKIKSMESEKKNIETTLKEYEDRVKSCNREIQEWELAFANQAHESEKDQLTLTEISNKNATLDTALIESQRDMQELKRQESIHKDQIRDLREKLSHAESKIKHQQDELATLEAREKGNEKAYQIEISALKQHNEDKERMTEEIESKLKQSTMESKELDTTLKETKASLEMQANTVSQLKEEKQALENHLKEIEDIHTAKLSSLQELQTDTEKATLALVEEMRESKSKIQTLKDNLTLSDSKIQTLEDSVARLSTEKEALESNLVEMEDTSSAKITALEDVNMENVRMSQDLSHRLTQSEAEIKELKSCLKEKVSEIGDLSNEKAMLEKTILEMEDISAAKDATIRDEQNAMLHKEDHIKTLQSQANNLQDRIKELEASVIDLKSDMDAKDSEIEQIRSVRDEIEMQRKETEAKMKAKESSVETLMSDIEIHSNEIEDLLLKLMQITSEKQELESLFVELKHSHDSLATENVSLNDQYANAMERRRQVEEELSVLKNAYGEMEQKNTVLEVSCNALKSSEFENRDQLVAYEEEIVELSEQINTVFTEAISFEERYEELKSKYEKLQGDLEQKSFSFNQIQSEKESQVHSKNMAIREYEEEISNLSEQIDIVFNEAYCFEKQKKELEDDLRHRGTIISQLEGKVESMSTAREDAIRSLRVCETERDVAISEVENMKASRETLIQSLRDREGERDEAVRELERLYDENRDLNNKSFAKTAEDDLRDELSNMKSQNIELRHLLASVNESEERLRNAVMAAENNCMVKSQELEDAEDRAAQMEEELKRIRKEGLERRQTEATQADLNASIEKIRTEKEEIEHRLQQEREERIRLQHQMGEEQRVLIQEGEKVMSDLRKELEQYEERLSQSESEAYDARKLIEEINDERNRLEEKFLETSAQLSSSESSKLKQDKLVAELQSQLNDAKSEIYALKESAIDLKEKMRRASRDSEKALRENNIATSELSTVRRKLLNLENLHQACETENSKLRKKLKEIGGKEDVQSELKKKDCDIISKNEEITSLKLRIEEITKQSGSATSDLRDDEVKELRRELQKMNESMKIKEKRIKKLEAVRLTKEQLAQIKKMKSDNLKYEEKCSKLEIELSQMRKHASRDKRDAGHISEVETYVKKCSMLENEISHLHGKIKSLEANSQSSEVSELRFDKQALERKLRKFATHCQRLEDDRAGMADALRSCNIDLDSHGNDINEAVIHLCDKFTSIEESYTNLQNDSAHKKEKNSLQQKINRLSLSEKTLLERLNQCQQENAELQDKLDVTKAQPSVEDSQEHREKIRYLEHENLQLLQDVKSVKRQLHAAREEIENLRVNSMNQNPTVDFGSFGVQTCEAESSSSILESPRDKSDTMELTNLAAACSKSKESSSKLRRSTRKVKKRNVLSETTNMINATDKTEVPMDKRQKITTTAGTNKRIQKTSTVAIAAPGLGETSNFDTENTGECKQS